MSGRGRILCGSMFRMHTAARNGSIISRFDGGDRNGLFEYIQMWRTIYHYGAHRLHLAHKKVSINMYLSIEFYAYVRLLSRETAG